MMSNPLVDYDWRRPMVTPYTKSFAFRRLASVFPI